MAIGKQRQKKRIRDQIVRKKVPDPDPINVLEAKADYFFGEKKPVLNDEIKPNKPTTPAIKRTLPTTLIKKPFKFLPTLLVNNEIQLIDVKKRRYSKDPIQIDHSKGIYLHPLQPKPIGKSRSASDAVSHTAREMNLYNKPKFTMYSFLPHAISKTRVSQNRENTFCAIIPKASAFTSTSTHAGTDAIRHGDVEIFYDNKVRRADVVLLDAEMVLCLYLVIAMQWKLLNVILEYEDWQEGRRGE